MFGIISLTCFSALLGLNQVFVKLVNDAMNPIFQAGMRSLCALPLVVLYCLWKKKKIKFNDGSLIAGIICSLLFSAEFILLFLALDYTTVARTSIFFYTMPFWLTLSAHFIIPNEKLNIMKIVGMIIAFIGVIIAFADRNGHENQLAWIGDAMCILAAMAWAGIALLARASKLARCEPEMQLVYQLMISAPVILIVSAFVGETFRQPEIWHFAIFAFQVVVVVAFGFTFWFFLLARYPASAIASFGFLAPVFGVLFGWAILKEEINQTIIIALVMVASGIVLVNRKSQKINRKN